MRTKMSWVVCVVAVLALVATQCKKSTPEPAAETPPGPSAEPPPVEAPAVEAPPAETPAAETPALEADKPAETTEPAAETPAAEVEAPAAAAKPELAQAGFQTPSKLGEALAAAVASDDPAIAASFFPSDELLASSIVCKEKNPATEVAQQRARLAAKLADIRQEGLKLAWSGIPNSPHKVTLAAGVEQGGCTPKLALTVQAFRFDFKVKVGEKTETIHEDVKLMRFGPEGRWYLVEF